jgi:hypothetical protein
MDDGPTAATDRFGSFASSEEMSIPLDTRGSTFGATQRRSLVRLRWSATPVRRCRAFSTTTSRYLLLAYRTLDNTNKTSLFGYNRSLLAEGAKPAAPQGWRAFHGLMVLGIGIMTTVSHTRARDSAT